MGTSNLAMSMARGLGGTFVTDDHGQDGGKLFEAFLYSPASEEALEEERRLWEPRRFIPIEEVPANNSGDYYPRFFKLQGSLQDAVRQMVNFGPPAALKLYRKALERERPSILGLLPQAIGDAVTGGKTDLSAWQSAEFSDGCSCAKFLQQRGRIGCKIAQAMLDALTTPAAGKTI